MEEATNTDPSSDAILETSQISNAEKKDVGSDLYSAEEAQHDIVFHETADSSSATANATTEPEEDASTIPPPTTADTSTTETVVPLPNDSEGKVIAEGRVEPPSPEPTEAKEGPPSASKSGHSTFGRRGDVRMHRALAARVANPEMSLLEALIAGGFEFPENVEGSSDRNICDSDGVLLCQRKNQLSRRLRLERKKKGGATKEKVNPRDKNVPPLPQAMFDQNSAHMQAMIGMKLPGMNQFLTAVDPQHGLQMVFNQSHGQPMATSTTGPGQETITASQPTESSDESGPEKKKLKTDGQPDKMTMTYMPAHVYGQMHRQMHQQLHPSFFNGQAYPPPSVTGDLSLLTQQPGGQAVPHMQAEHFDRYLDLAAASMGIEREQFQSLLRTNKNGTDDEKNGDNEIKPSDDAESSDQKESSSSEPKDKEESDSAAQPSMKQTKLALAMQIFKAENPMFIRRCLMVAGFVQSDFDEEGQTIIEDFQKQLAEEA